MAAKKKKLVVIFDTNALFTDLASELVRLEVKDLITRHSSYSDLEIVWLIPSVVIDERKFQMLKAARLLLPNLKKMEKLLNLQLTITNDTLEFNVDRVINSSMTKLGLAKLNVDEKNIDWANVISRSVMRLPPFKDDGKEKGFRDVIVGQCALTAHETYPKNPSICKIAIVTDDDLLQQYIGEILPNAKNIRLISKNDGLDGLINTLTSNLDEELAASLQQKAGKLFFTEGSDNSLFVKEDIESKISIQFSKVLADTIHARHVRTNGQWWINDTFLARKEGNKIYWTTPIEVDFKTTETIYNHSAHTAFLGETIRQNGRGLLSIGSSDPFPPSARIGSSNYYDPVATNAARVLAGLSVDSGGFSNYIGSGLAGFTGSALGGLSIGSEPIIGSTRNIIRVIAKDKFDVTWETTLSNSGNLTKAKLESIKYVEREFIEGDEN